MNKTIFKIAGLFFCVLVGNTACATSNLTDDQLTQLINKVQQQNSGSEKNRSSNQTARDSWQVKCWVRVFEDSKICVIQKEHITVMRINNIYSVNIGNKHLKESFSSLRIDGNKVIKAQEGLYRSGMPIIEQMKRGYYLFSRYQTQEKANTIENKVSLMGFTDAYNDMQVRYRKLDGISSTQR